MRRTMLLAALALAAIPISIADGCFNAGPASGSSAPTLARQVEERFAINFCYGQYRSQDDVLRCLAEIM